MSENEVKTYDWDDEISNDGEGNYEETTVLPDGNYDFEVVKTEKAFYEPKPGSSLPACNMCKVYLRILSDLGTSLVVENLYLCERTDWKISAFLRSIGLKKHGEAASVAQLLHCDGEKGRCQIKVDTFTGKNGQEMQNNKLVRFFDKDETRSPLDDVNPPRIPPKNEPKRWAKGAF